MQENEKYLTRVANRLMSASQRALDEMNCILDDLSFCAEANERDDIKAFANDVKTKCIQPLRESWLVGDHWAEHFDGLAAPSEDESGDDDTDTKDEETDEEATDDGADDSTDDE